MTVVYESVYRQGVIDRPDAAAIRSRIMSICFRCGVCFAVWFLMFTLYVHAFGFIVKV